MKENYFWKNQRIFQLAIAFIISFQFCMENCFSKRSLCFCVMHLLVMLWQGWPTEGPNLVLKIRELSLFGEKYKKMFMLFIDCVLKQHKYWNSTLHIFHKFCKFFAIVILDFLKNSWREKHFLWEFEFPAKKLYFSRISSE